MRRWTEDMEAYLEKSWGSISTKKLAQNLNVTEAAVKNKACKMGLGSMLSNKDFLIAKELESLLGTDRKSIRKNINERGLKAKEVKLTSANRKYIAIKYDDLVEWLENNTKFWNAAKADILALKALGVDPDLLNKKYKEDVEKFNRRNIDEETLNKIKEYYLKGYSYEDISKLVNKDKDAIENKMRYLSETGEFALNRNNGGNLIRRSNRRNYGWSKAQDELLMNLFLEGVPLKEISLKVGKSLAATKTRNRVLSKRKIQGLPI